MTVHEPLRIHHIGVHRLDHLSKIFLEIGLRFFAQSYFPDATRPGGILDLLADGEKAVTELLGHFSFSQPALSKHLKILLGAGLVQRRVAGRARIYRLEPLGLRRVHDWVSHYERFWRLKLDALDNLLEELP